jgi:DHA2 family multidrug resistance protein
MTGVQRAAIMATCTSVTFLYAMTVSIANVSLPQMQGALSATQDQIAWVVTFNIVATAIATPLSGWLMNRFGQRRLMLVCVVGFAAASLACGLADSLESLVLYRILQGACGAPLVPVSQAIILNTYPKEQHGTAIAIFGVGVVFGPIVGPVVGGYLSEAYNWRWVFYMILPFTAIALVGVLLFIRKTANTSVRRLDWTGFLALAVGVACVQLMLDRGHQADWFASGEIIIYAGLAVTSLYVFITHCLTTDAPFLNPALLRDRNYAVGVVIVLVFGMLNFTPMTLLPPLLQNVRGYPDSVIGVVLGARGLGTLLGFTIMIYASRTEPRFWLALGFLMQAAAGLWMAQFDINLTTGGLFWAVFLQGLGVGLLWVPISTVSFSTLPPRLVPEGMAFFHLVRNFGSSIHISLSILLVIHMTTTSYATLSESVAEHGESLTLPWIMGAFDVESLQGLAVLSGEMSRQASMIGYIDSFYFFAYTAIAVLPLIALVRVKR